MVQRKLYPKPIQIALPKAIKLILSWFIYHIMIVFRRNFGSAFIIYGKVILPLAVLSRENNNDGWLSELFGLIATRLRWLAQNQYDWRNFNMVGATLTSFCRALAQFSGFTRSIIRQYF